MTMQNDATLDDGASAPGLSALARQKLTRELATIKTDIAAVAGGPTAALTRLKLVARANHIRAQLGSSLTPAPAVGGAKAFEVGTIQFEALQRTDPRRPGQAYWALKIVDTGEINEDFTAESAPKLQAKLEDDLKLGLKGDIARWRASFKLPPLEAPAPVATEAPEVAELRDVVAGQHDGLGLDGLLAKIEKAARALHDAGALSGDIEALAHDAVTHWARLELQNNG